VVPSKKARIITIHGGAGRRDESTRAERGEICAKNSDIFIVTEDDSRDEDPAEIAQMFVDGATKAGMKVGENLLIELDRKKAIKKAFELAKKNDLVLVLGKGHEKTILRADGPHDFEDLKVSRELLKKMK
jgi:UDP-N-acetylmuramoyl-L-alanyl-D-glutamate--2,6-diaminopimelate ligase